MTKASETPTADSLWKEAMRLFSNFRAMRPRRSWFTGISVAAGRKRLDRLTASKAAAKLMPKLAALPDGEFAIFQTYAQINLEQAEAAMRLSLIANITIPVGLVVITNQLFPETVENFVAYLGADALIVACCLAGPSLFLAIWYCYAGVFQGRDLVHLTAIAEARRGKKSGGAPRAGRTKRNSGEDPAPTDTIEQML